MDDNRRENDSKMWEAIDSIRENQSKMAISQEKILTLLIGEADSGLCGRVKNIETELKESPEKKRNFWIGLTASIAAVIGILIAIFKKG